MSGEKNQKIFDFVNSMQSINNEIALLKLNAESNLHYFYNGGNFYIDENLISFTNLLLQKNITDTILLDSNKLPIKIINLKDFHERIFSRYFEVLNDYLVIYEKLKKVKDNKDILDI